MSSAGSGMSVPANRTERAEFLPLAINPALVERILLGFIQDEVRKVGFQRVVIGLSGGVDSSLAATLAARALGPSNVKGLLMPVVGKYMNRVDPRVFATASFVIFAVVLLMRSWFNTQADVFTLLVPTIIQGAAVAVFFVPLINLSMSGLAPEHIPSASGLFNFARITAGAFGTSIVTTWWDRRATLHHAQAESPLALDPAPPHGVSEFLCRLGDHCVAVVIQPIDKRSDWRVLLVFNQRGIVKCSDETSLGAEQFE